MDMELFILIVMEGMVSCMKVLGIVAEYDPFHNGHLHHIVEAKKKICPDLTYIVLSPCVKQRGELSLLSPVDRARCALQAGADAVFSLPVLWTVRDAEHYALGAVSLLSGLGVTHLAFGAETADIGLLRQAAALLESPVPLFQDVLRKKLAAGAGYPAALSAALSAALPAAAGILDSPNNILAVCYLRALIRLGHSMEAVAIPRSGNYHAAGINPSAPSASALRENICRGNYAGVFQAVPEWTAGLLRQRFLEKRIPLDVVLDTLLISRLRSMDTDGFSSLPDLSEGMENRLREAARAAVSRSSLIADVSGRRYPAARISRLCACALLGITREIIAGAPLPQAALLLGFRNRPEMTAQWKSLPIPVVSSFTEWKNAAHPSDLAAWHLWALCCCLPDTLPFSEKLAIL